MKQERDPRYKTVNINKSANRTQRKLSSQFVSNDIIHNQQESNEVCITPKGKDVYSKHYSNRNSGRINITPFAGRLRQKSQFENVKNQAKIQLSKLTYREKLNQIQYFFKSARQLCKTYGYFYATFAMITFTLDQPIKINLWIHPDTRCKKPLHPIKKQTNFQCQVECVCQLKKLIKMLFPATDVGDGKTFSNVIAHIEVAKADLDTKKRRESNNFNIQINKKDYFDSPTYVKNIDKRNINNTDKQHIKSMPNQYLQKYQEQALQYENKTKGFKIDQKNKQTKSTLIQSFRSANSIKQRLRNQISNSPKTKQQVLRDCKKSRKASWIYQLKPQTSRDCTSTNLTPTTPTRIQTKTLIIQQKIQRIRKQSIDNNSIRESLMKMKNSVSGKKLMSMSIQMQSQINNLFGNDDFGMNSFYLNSMQKKALKNSVLSKVAEEFQDLF